MNPKKITSEAQLIALAKKNRQYFEPLYEKYFDPIFGFVYKRIGDEQMAADIAQQVFYEAMVHLGKYEERGFPFSSWLYRIAINMVNQYYRNSSKMRHVEIEENTLQFVVEAFEIKEAEQDPSEVLADLFAHLSQEEFLMLEMKYLEGKSYKEIGEILSLTETNAKVRTHRIITKLRGIIQQ